MKRPQTETTHELEKIKASEKNLDKIRGALIGGAIGDALGYPVEFLTLDRITGKYGEQGITAYELDRISGKALISDDTQMTLFTANGILFGETRGVCAALVLRRMIMWRWRIRIG